MDKADVIGLLQQENERLKRENERLMAVVRQIMHTVNRLLECYVVQERS